MSQFVDFVGLNTFIYEANGFFDLKGAAGDGYASIEFVSTDGIAGSTGYIFTYPNTIGSFGFAQGGLPYTHLANIDPRSEDYYRFSYRDIRSLMNKKYELYLSASRVPGIASSASYFPALMLKRNGPYGHPMFKQIRVHENPLTRKQNKEGIFTIVESPSDEIIKTFGSNRQTKVIRSRFGDIHQYREAPLTSKYKPLDWLVGLSPDNERIDNQQELTVDNIERVVMRNSFGNDINFFANTDLNNRLGLEVLKDEDYEKITNLYLDGGLDSDGSPISTFEFLKYSETVFPRETNTYRKIARKRYNFINSFWRDGRVNRSVVPADVFGNFFQTSTSGSGYRKPSMWALDADVDFTSRNIVSASSEFFGFNGNAGTPIRGELSGGAGVLQNQFVQVTNKNIASLGSGDIQPQLDNNFRVSPVLSRRHTLGTDINGSSESAYNVTLSSSFALSVVSPDGIFIAETASANFGRSGIGVKYQGQALWEAGTQAGKDPFDSSYDVWWEQLRLKAKDYSVVPEFRISDFVETIEVSGALNFIDNMLAITGGASGELDLYDPMELAAGNDSSETKFYETYSTTDFMKHFAKIKKDHVNFVEPSKITLTCKAFKKFLAYDSFYPALRTVDIAQQFSSSYSDHITFSSSYGNKTPSIKRAIGLQTILKPLMAPGILMNSIKSGIACDYPVTDTGFTFEFVSGSKNGVKHGWTTSKILSETPIAASYVYPKRLPFETIYNPDKYIANVNIAWDEVDPNSYIGNLSASWNGSGDNLYKKMVDNFLAETVDFFLEDSQLSFIASKKQSDPTFGVMKAGKSYGMRIKVGKTYSTPKKMFESMKGQYYPPNNFIEGDDFARENITMYSRPSAFGPPVNARAPTGVQTNNVAVTGGLPAWTFFGSNIGYNFPFTPPYYYGEAWCDVLFHADTTKKHTLTEILEGADYYLTRVDPESYASSSINIRNFDVAESHAPARGIQGTGSSDQNTYTRTYGLPETNYTQTYNDGINNLTSKVLASNVCRNAMQIVSSLNVNAKAVLTDTGLSFTTLADGDPNESWIIQPKWECPILNFNNVSITIEEQRDGQAPRGMWHQYGVKPATGESIYMQVEDIPKSWTVNFVGNSGFSATGSLADVCGFTNEQVPLGKPTSKKIIKEAVVAVPYVEHNGTKRFYSISEEQVTNAKKFVEAQKLEQNEPRSAGATVPSEFYKPGTTDTVITMVKAMDEFIFPPTMDFVHFADKIKPFAMYVFEFSHALDEQDVTDIWQNLPPKIASKFEEAQATIEHPLFAKQFLSTYDSDQETNPPTGGVLNDKIRWMVFKVKQRAKKNYDSKLAASVSNRITKRKTFFPEGAREREEIYEDLLSYNWPYDFFSLVEMVKLESEITFSDVSPDAPNSQVPKGSPKKDKSSRTTPSLPSKSDTPSATQIPNTLPAQALEGAQPQGQTTPPQGAGPDGNNRGGR